MPRLSEGFRALRTRNYRLFWTGQTLSQIGSWMQMTAQGWLVLQLSKSPFEVGLVTALQFTPALLLSFFGGAIADRFDRHRLLFVTQSCAALQSLLFAILVSSGQIALWHVFSLALMLGLVNAFDTPIRQSFVPSIVPRDDLPNAIALNSLIINTARVIGPSVAGILIATLGMAAAFWVNASSYAAILCALGLMDRSQIAPGQAKNPESILTSMKEALVFVRGAPQVCLSLILMAFFGTFGYNFNTFIPLIGGFVLKVDPVQYGGLTSAQGVGAVIGAITVGFLGRPSPRRLFAASLLFSAALALVCAVPIYWAVASMLGVLGVAAVSFTTSANTAVQMGSPDELRGRVMSLYWTLFAGTTPIGALFVGSMAKWVGVPATLMVCAGLCLVGVAVGFAYWSRHRDAWKPA